MCGRTCLTLEPNEICTCCSRDNKPLKWRPEYNLGRKYEGHIDGKGYNTTPQDITPVLASNAHFDEVPSSDTVVVPMMWGLIPRWHKGDYRKHGLTTNNCRLEDLSKSKLYLPLLKAGKRCVVLCEGFYEWQTVTGAKSSDRKVYYIYFPQNQGIVMEDKTTWKDVNNLNLFKVAGLFDYWVDEEENKMFSYTIITYESNETLSWLHHRTPAILETQQQVDDWLDYKRVPEKEALELLTPVKMLKWHQVSKVVNNSRNKSEQCNKPLDKLKGNKLMKNWLKRANTSSTSKEDAKKVKTEEN